ncbi:IucA/IucC family C-terminal-domain containing protein [Salinicola avicenniae]|uniref:IucA/IucC family C-terminal-domain containing protein n=1 Tax=Salinicola avicenniae TaxID=2916836 RepID=UPI00207450C0|nr:MULTISPECIES: IucA/IucC family C-terminal-domain containing protein [unclassified Salinicola]
MKSAEAADPAALTVAEFLKASRCRELLDELGPTIGASDRRTTASLLSKRLAFLLTGAPLYALSVCDRRLDVSPVNCLIEFTHDGESWRSSLPLHSLAGTPMSPSVRREARRESIRQLFAELISPLWGVLQSEGGVAPRILWENLAVRVYSLYERRLSALDDPGVIRQCDEDFRWLLAAEPDLFGLDFNPLGRFLFDRTALPDGSSIRYRRTCCLYYKTKYPGRYCETCPLLKHRGPRE